ncbi:MAG: SH3 domain-containing protein [Rhizobiaceae bacterium]|nr:SH3 domain-containing protein [Rhizobiaceae bacterium]
MDRRSALIAFAGAALAFGLGSGSAAAQYCEGTVHGLSGRYNLAKGTGFLAVRARPSSSARMVGQLFNGDTVEIFDRRGNWYRVAMGGIDGWAHARWMRNSCGY